MPMESLAIKNISGVSQQYSIAAFFLTTDDDGGLK